MCLSFAQVQSCLQTSRRSQLGRKCMRASSHTPTCIVLGTKLDVYPKTLEVTWCWHRIPLSFVKASMVVPDLFPWGPSILLLSLVPWV